MKSFELFNKKPMVGRIHEYHLHEVCYNCSTIDILRSAVIDTSFSHLYSTAIGDPPNVIIVAHKSIIEAVSAILN